ncbi:MAG: LPXTG cell wall anchor domain-containing protein [Eubacterium sp.]|nr:LPXTG cell wall anchor domain-containing protein [Eubacterium sp.]
MKSRRIENKKKNRCALRKQIISIVTAGIVLASTYGLGLSVAASDGETASSEPVVESEAEPLVAESVENTAAESEMTTTSTEGTVSAEAPVQEPEAQTDSTSDGDASGNPSDMPAEDADNTAPVVDGDIADVPSVPEGEGGSSEEATPGEEGEDQDSLNEENGEGEDQDSLNEEDEEDEDTEEENEEDEVAYPPQSFEIKLEGGNLIVTAEAEEDTFPEGTTMDAVAVRDPAILDTITDKVESDDTVITSVKAVDITFKNKDGDKIEPKKAIKVTITSEEIAQAEDNTIVHVDDQGTAEIVTAEDPVANMLGDNEVLFKSDEFSVYAIVGTETITATLLTGDGKTLKVTVNYDEDAQIPEGATLDVKEITENDDEWVERSSRLAHALSEEYGNYYISDARFLSISIMVDGKEFEPKAPVEIIVEYTDPMQTEYTVDTVDTDPNGIGEFAGLEEEPQMTSRFAVVHYEGNTPQILDAEIEKSEDLITESITMTPGFSDYDFVNFDEYEAREAEYDSMPGTIGTLKASDVMLAAADAPVLRNAGDVPNHSKSLTDNQNGTYTIGLNVEGDADTTSEASDVNVLIVYDVSSSMTIYHAPSETGRYGAPTSTFSTTYTTLYYRNGSNYAQLNSDTYTGTVYTRTNSRPYQYNEYTGKRYSSLWRADVAEKTLYDFVHALFGYQNEDGDNINAAVVTFDASAHVLPRNNVPSTGVTWTQTESDITQYLRSNGTSHNSALYGSGTNWEAAMDAANDAVNAITNDNPTYVVFITDGAPTNRNNSTNRDVEPCYEAARDEARDVYEAATESGGEFFGIYAYGEEADWLASLMYYAYNNAEPPSNIRGTTFDTDGYYNAASTAALTAAINEIFQKIVQTLGVTEVSITDGTTSNVATSTGVAHLLVVDDSYQYWLSIPVTAGSGGTYTFIMPDKVTGDYVTYTVTPDAAGENVTISWAGGSVTYAGSVNLNTLTIEWTEATGFYNYNPPAASYNSTTGAVEWNLHPVGTLLDGVTYTVTFDCYPSQETLDLIADLKNGDIQYSNLDPAIQQYLTSDYQLKTNTTATLSYTDTRPGGGSGSIEYVNPDPQPVNATEEVTVSKIWNNSLDSREGWKQDLDLYVTRDDVEVHTVELTRDNNWTGTAWISYGILTEDENGVHLKTTGHDYSFSEDVETGYYWEIKAPTIRPMLIGTTVTMLKLVENPSEDITSAFGTDANAKAHIGDGTYYKLTIDGEVEYYVVVEDVSSALTATNHRRSYLDVVKSVTGGNVPEGDEFTFTMTIDNANDETANPEDVNSDSWVWFSIWDTVNNAQVTDPDAATAEEMRWQLNDDQDDGTVVTTKPAAADFNGYFCVPSETPITVNMQNGYSLRFLNLPEGTIYTIAESETMPADGYSFVSIEGTRSYDADQDPETTDDWTTVSTGTATGQSITGTIEYVESAYKVTVTNKWNTIDVKLKKTDEGGTVLNGSTFTLTSGETIIGTYSPDSTDSKVGNPVDLGGLGIGTYKLEETVVPTNYTGSEDVYFQVYKDTDGSLKARMVDASGNVLDDQSAITSESGTDGLIYTITVENTLKTATVKVTKNVVGLEGDQSKEFAFTTTGVATQAQMANLTNGQSVTYTEIPYGTSVTVTETTDNSFDTTYSVNGTEAVTGTSATFTVDDTTVTDGIAEVIFTNTRSKQLIKVYKYETGNENKALEGAVFTLTGPEGSDISYAGLETNADGYLENNGSVYIELPVNTNNYTLTETNAPDGYNKMTENVLFTVSTTGVSATGSGYSVTSATETVDGVSVMVYTIKVQNSAGVELPMTGGSGTLPYTLGGITLIMASALMYGFRMRRRERGLN